ncbi:MAG: PorV/PorQ family protein [Phycisphaerales bacterium]|nr:PorV/PorQ family protein [Phycisphaerales bacterium]
MKNIVTKAILSTISLSCSFLAFAGNKDRSGQAGATELLINPWAQSTGLFGLDVANVKGIAAMKVNIAGLTATDNLEIGVSSSRYLSGAGITVNNAGAAYRLSPSSVIGVNVMSMSFGEIDITTVDAPEGTSGKYRPSFLNVSFGFATEFSHSIRGGVNGTFITEQIGNINAVGASVDAGIQYLTGIAGNDDNLHIGITLRNAGTNMRFSGGGFASESPAPNDPTYNVVRMTPQEKFQLPTYMSLAFAYDFYLDEKYVIGETKPKHRITALANFTSNSFNNDFLGAGVEYAFKERFMIRSAYRYEKDITDKLKSTSFYTGLSLGATVSVPVGKSGPVVALDYSYRPTQRPANGVHVIGLRFNFNSKAAAKESASSN